MNHRYVFKFMILTGYFDKLGDQVSEFDNNKQNGPKGISRNFHHEANSRKYPLLSIYRWRIWIRRKAQCVAQSTGWFVSRNVINYRYLLIGYEVGAIVRRILIGPRGVRLSPT